MSISVQKISKSFKGRRKTEPENQVLKDVSFEVQEGEFVSLLGPSGCGKTTTLTIIAGFQKPSGGVHVPELRTVSMDESGRKYRISYEENEAG